MSGKYNWWWSFHQHSHLSNPSYWECVTKFQDYVDYAVKHKIPIVTTSEHGSNLQWIKRKEEAEAAGLKFADSMEAYVTMSLDSKNKGFHTIMIAKNYEGVKTINRLSSASFNRHDGHFYYRPRILFDELCDAISEGNLFVTTACLASGLAQSYMNSHLFKKQSDAVNVLSVDDEQLKDQEDDTEIEHDAITFKRWVKLATQFPNDVFLEVQPHVDRNQSAYNKLLAALSKQYNLKLIAANDVHALNPYHDKLRKIIKKGKKNTYSDEDNFELWCKSREEMVDTFHKQGVLTDTEINEALDNTVKIANQIEEFELDKSHKYPHLYKNPEKEFQKRIKRGLHERGIDELDPRVRKRYVERVNHEYKVYKGNGAIDYMLAHQDIMTAAKKHGVHFGYSRGSVAGSLIAYLCGQTEMDSVKLGLNFERFMNPERISLADIDLDSWKPDQQWIQKWMLTNPRWHAASIMTANTYGLKAAIKVIADGMDRYTGKPAYIQSIRNQIGDDGYIPEDLYEQHHQLLDYAKDVIGVIDSIGRHAAGILIDTNTIDDHVGIQTISGWDYPVTQCAMKEIDHFNWVKFDMLGLDNVGLISRTAELAEIPFPTPNSEFIDFEDKKVWESMRENNIGIFQMEGDRAGKLLRDMLSPETIANIHANEAGKNVKYMDLLSLVNAAQRPSGASYVDAVTHGRFKDNGHPALNEFLAPTLGELVYQEQLTQFLVQFCGRTPGQADVLRRAVGKKNKQVIDEEVPKIHKDFVNTMINKYHDTPEHAEKIAKDFMQVFMDAANYGFSINHSMAYSYIGYISTWLRYYYPLEWCTAAFEIWKGKQDKINRVTKFAEEHGIKMSPVKFCKSKGLYYMDKKTNTIYEGTATIKGCNQQIGDQLYSLRSKKYKFFVDLLMDIYDKDIIVSPRGEFTVSGLYKAFCQEQIKQIDLSLKKKANKYSIKSFKPLEINRSNMLNLIALDYFKEFGTAKKLVEVYNFFKEKYKPKNKRYAGKQEKYFECIEYEKSLGNDDYSITEHLASEYKLLGRCITQDTKIPANFAFVTNLIKRSNKVIVKLYSIKKGKEVTCYISIHDWSNSGLKAGDLLKIISTHCKPKLVKADGKWIKSTHSSELWITDYRILQNSN